MLCAMCECVDNQLIALCVDRILSIFLSHVVLRFLPVISPRITMRNLKTITEVIVLNIPRRMILEPCKEWHKCEIDCPRHTHAPSCTTAQLVNLGSTVGGDLGNLSGTTSDRLLYACLSMTHERSAIQPSWKTKRNIWIGRNHLKRYH
jgi:hypothetical protein